MGEIFSELPYFLPEHGRIVLYKRVGVRESIVGVGGFRGSGISQIGTGHLIITPALCIDVEHLPYFGIFGLQFRNAEEIGLGLRAFLAVITLSQYKRKGS